MSLQIVAVKRRQAEKPISSIPTPDALPFTPADQRCEF
ncbi:unnamed protein product [Penicillium camemberti]|uniref:Str. FM013 n=1 Tax=Penicillium camemberti (strain FM 013) TaxID=1429867 RepID=A0A0G4PW43_PENC3|nr:unnamed protein product [Penicillium camemberti]CRL31169.1 unnamed protein product [Penicillium camemberti]CRL31225.1 unnamed protein product [Penicillium camemberti]